MRISSNPPTFFVFCTLSCPDCGVIMRLFAIVPMSAVQDGDEFTYRCDACEINLKRFSKIA
jgi:hypothetical protein